MIELVTIGGQTCRAHRDTCKTRKRALAVAAELRRGARVYDVDLGHTVPAKNTNPLDELMNDL